MEVHIRLSNGACLLLGAGLGVAIAFLMSSSVDADDKKKRENNRYENAATSASKIINQEKLSKYYGDRTMSEILDKAKLEICKVWDRGWRVILLNSKNSSTISSDAFVDARTSFPETDNQIKEASDPILDLNDSVSTIYTPVGRLDASSARKCYSSLNSKVHKGLHNVATGCERSNTSKNDSICKNCPRHSTFISSENKSSTEDNTMNENIGTIDESNSKSESKKDKKLVLSFKTPLSPIIRAFEAVKRFLKRPAKKRAREKSDENAEAKDSNGHSVDCRNMNN